MIEIIIPVGILLAIAIICAVLLTLAQRYFGVEVDEREAAIRDCLPGANCGACGYSGCDGYAAALASGKCDKANLCVPGGDGAARDIAGILGVEAEDVVERVAYVACNGTCDVVAKRYDYQGVESCRTANMSYSGDRMCTFACLGYGDCAAVCPENAICITERGVAEIDPRKCVGCGLCEKTCPNNIIHLVNDTTRVVVKCNNKNKGAQVRKICENGCIGCGKCERTCPVGAIKVVDNLAVIDYELCTGCGACRDACPIHCIHEGNFRCGAHIS